MTWKIEVSDKQAGVIMKALEVYSRMLMGQISTILEEFPDLSWDDRQYIHNIARQHIFKELDNSHAFYSISSDKINPKAQIAWDIQQVVRQAVSWHRAGKKLGEDKRDWSEMLGVDFDDPFPSNSEPLCKIERIEE
jgi:hypothetical protein